MGSGNSTLCGDQRAVAVNKEIQSQKSQEPSRLSTSIVIVPQAPTPKHAERQTMVTLGGALHTAYHLPLPARSSHQHGGSQTITEGAVSQGTDPDWDNSVSRDGSQCPPEFERLKDDIVLAVQEQPSGRIFKMSSPPPPTRVGQTSSSEQLYVVTDDHWASNEDNTTDGGNLIGVCEGGDRCDSRQKNSETLLGVPSTVAQRTPTSTPQANSIFAPPHMATMPDLSTSPSITMSIDWIREGESTGSTVGETHVDDVPPRPGALLNNDGDPLSAIFAH